MNQTNALTINHLTIMYGACVALDDISLTVPTGVICAIIGPNGAGKSTLLKAMLGLIKPLAGTITVDSMPVSRAYESIAYVPQRFSVDWTFPISVFEVVLMGRYGGGLSGDSYTATDVALVNQALTQVDMLSHAQTLIGDLSGGQQQRVFLARALAQQRTILILDEPFNGVDAATEQLCITLLHQLQRTGVTIFIVDHALTSVRTYADWVIALSTKLLYGGPIEQQGSHNDLMTVFPAKSAALYEKVS